MPKYPAAELQNFSAMGSGNKKTATYRVTVFRLLFHLSGQKSVA